MLSVIGLDSLISQTASRVKQAAKGGENVFWLQLDLNIPPVMGSLSCAHFLDRQHIALKTALQRLCPTSSVSVLLLPEGHVEYGRIVLTRYLGALTCGLFPSKPHMQVALQMMRLYCSQEAEACLKRRGYPQRCKVRVAPAQNVKLGIRRLFKYQTPAHLPFGFLR